MDDIEARLNSAAINLLTWADLVATGRVTAALQHSMVEQGSLLTRLRKEAPPSMRDRIDDLIARSLLLSMDAAASVEEPPATKRL